MYNRNVSGTASDRATLIAQLGFSDPDLLDPVHDAGCDYLNSTIGREALIGAMGPRNMDFRVAGESSVQKSRFKTLDLRSQRDRAITWGRKSSRRTVGFIDIVIHHRYEFTITRTEAISGKILVDHRGEVSRPLLIDVKVHPESIGRIIRQMNLYRDFIDDHVDDEMVDLKGYALVVATCYEPEAHELLALEQANIYHLFLGAKFDRYISHRDSSTANIRVCEV